MISFNAYFFLSLIVTVVSVINAVTLHEQFYSTMIYLSTSKIHRLVILNLSFSLFCALLRGLLSFFFQDIRESEKLSILEKVKRKVFDFALMLIVFREDSLDLTFFGISLKFVNVLQLGYGNRNIIGRRKFYRNIQLAGVFGDSLNSSK